MQDNVHFGSEARDKIIAGIRKCAAAVGVTMGTGGSNSLIEAMETPGYLNTNDGATILQAIRLADPLEEMGRKALVEAVARSNKASGDGSSTCCVLTAAIIEEGLKYLGNHSSMDIKRSLEACIPEIEKAIQAQKRDITVDEVGAVATISAEDSAIGAKIQEIYQQIGKTGIVYWDVSKTAEDSYTIGSGITVEGAGIASPYMCDMDEKTGATLNVARVTSPKVLITREKITTAAVFESLFTTLNSKGTKEVLIFCDDIEATVVAQLIQTRYVRGFKAILVKMPVLWKDWWYEDLALASGATVIDPAAGIALRDAKPEHLGTFGHVTIDKDNTYIDGIADVSAHVAQLEAEGSDDSKLRASRLNTKTARYYVGAHSESALSYRRLKVEDAIAAAYHALNGGIVAGGGVALVHTANTLPLGTVGANILLSALKAPAKQIAANVGKFDIVIGDDYTATQGFDSKTMSFVDMFEAGITDPATITFNAAKNAISVATSVLTADTVVLLPRQEANVQAPVTI